MLARPVDGDRSVDLPRDALLPGEVPVVAVDELVDGAAVGVVDGPSAQLQEPQSQVQDGAGAAFEQDLGAGAVRLAGEPGRGEHAELPPQAVLLRRGAVGVEQVALEEDGVGDAAGLGERGSQVVRPRLRGHGASFSSRSTVSSHVGSTRSER